MEKNNQYDILLIKYLANEVNAGERRFVESWINESNDNLLYFKRLEAAWQLAGTRPTLNYVLDEMNIEGKWNRFKQNIDVKENEISIQVQDQNDNEGPTERARGRKPAVYKLLIALAVAASIILIFLWGFPFFMGKPADRQVVVQRKNRQTRSAGTSLRHELNTTGKDKRIQLSDGSLIVLADKSEVFYHEAFTSERNITLIGKAYFKVAKDESTPFRVTSKDISTTALGTEFTVTAFKNTNRVIIRLYEGKVVVKALDKANRKLKNNVYLLPGQAFVYNDNARGKVENFKLNKDEVPEEIMIGEMSDDNNPSLPQHDEGSWYMFNNQSLAQVLDQLSQMYHVQIIYDKAEVQRIYFTRKYNNTESIDDILKEIAKLNDLIVTKKENVFVISK